VVEAGDGLMAVDKARSEKPDLILMDMNMPNVDGWEATRRLKADAALEPIPVLALSANALPGDSQRATEAGCAGYLTKPVEIEALVLEVEKTLRRTRRKS
jgi:CheY-like chemotaxis protein